MDDPTPTDPSPPDSTGRPAPRALGRLAAWTLAPRPVEDFGETCLEILRRTLWIVPCEWILMGLCFALGVGVGNAGADEVGGLLEQGVLFYFLVGAVLAPAFEEALFRGLPSLVSDWAKGRKDGLRWPLGFASAATFALVHNLTSKPGAHSIELSADLHFDYGTLPAPQFVFGLLLWDLVRRHGLWASALSHMLHNFLYLSLALLQARPS